MSTLTERKLMPMGGGSLVVTLPKGWVRFYQLKPGDKVAIIANDEILIRPIPKQGKSVKTSSEQA